MAMKERPKKPRDTSHSMKSHYWAMAEYFAEKARKARNDPDRCRYAAAAQRYRNLVKAEELAAKAALPPRNPSAPGC